MNLTFPCRGYGPDGSPIPVVEESKFLGIIFNRKLRFIPHIKYLKAKCSKALNLLKVLFPFFLRDRPNYTPQALSVSSPVKIRL